MMDSLPYRNDAAIVFRRLIRSLPRRKGVLGVATCDKGLPAMMMALAGSTHLPGVFVPGGVTLPPREGEDAGKVQTIGARYVARRARALKRPPTLGCRACASPGGGCQFLGTAATSQVVAEALGLTAPARRAGPLGPADLARHGPAVGPGAGRPRRGRPDDPATSSPTRPSATRWPSTRPSAGSTNLLLHIPAIAYAAGLRRPTSTTGTRSTVKVPRLVSVLPNGPALPPDRPRLPGRRRSRGHAPPSRPWSAR